MKTQLYKYDGTPLFEVLVDASSSQSWSLMSDNKLSLSFELEECVVLTAGCYIEFDNTRFYLLTEYKPTMVCRSAWKYDLTLGDAASWLSITLALKTTDGENAPLFKYTGPAVEHAAIIVANLNRLMGTDKWKVGSVISTENITIDYSGKYCSEVLQEIVDTKNTEWWIDDMTLNIGRAEFGDPIELGYQNGLLGDIIREQSDNSKSYRYLYPVGSTRNIDPTKYGYDRLQLPDGRTYIDMNVEQGIAELFEEAAFAHIFPRYEGTVQTVRTQIANGNSGPFVIYYFSDSNIPFNPNDYEIAGLKKQISFLSGELMGEDFEVNYNPSSKEFEIITKYPESSNNIQLPGGLLIPNIGDKYVIWNITMPAEYYSLASQELLEAAEAFAQKYIYDGGIYHASLDYIDVQLRSLRLRPGQRVRLQSPEYFPKTGHYDSRITRVTRSLWYPNEMNIDISSERSMGVIKKLSSDVKSAQTKSNTLSATLSTLNAAFVAHKMLFDEFFEKDSAGNIHAKLSLWSSGGITAGGVGSGGSGGGGGISYNRLDSWADYSFDKSGWVLSALLGYDINTRLTSVENAGYVTASALAPYVLRSEVEGQYLSKNGGTVNGSITLSIGNLVVSSGDTVVGKIYPRTDNEYTLGQDTRKWKNILCYNINGSTPVNASNLKSTLGISDWALASVKPTYTASEVGAVSVYGGTINSPSLASLVINRNNSTGASVITFTRNSDFTHFLGFNDNSGPKWLNADYQEYPLLHSGNYSSYALSVNGGTVNGSVYMNGWFLLGNSQPIAVADTDGVYQAALCLSGGNNFSIGYGTSVVGKRRTLLFGNIIEFKSNGGEDTTLALNADRTATFSSTVSAPSFIGNLTGTADRASTQAVLYGNRDVNLWDTDSSAARYFALADAAPNTPSGVYALGSILMVYSCDANAGAQLLSHNRGNNIFYRSRWNGAFKDWREIAFTDSNVASATKLATPRTIWGQSFDGTGNVGGDLYVHQLKIELGNEINSYTYNFNTANGNLHLNYHSSGHVTLANGGGNVAIGGTATEAKLHVYGNGKFTGALTVNSLTIGGVTLTYDSGNEALCINGNMYALGGVTAGGAGISTYSSLEARVARLEQQLNIS